MSVPEDIPEDRCESFPCECGGDITLILNAWQCNKCDCWMPNESKQTKEKE